MADEILNLKNFEGKTVRVEYKDNIFIGTLEYYNDQKDTTLKVLDAIQEYPKTDNQSCIIVLKNAWLRVRGTWNVQTWVQRCAIVSDKEAVKSISLYPENQD